MPHAFHRSEYRRAERSLFRHRKGHKLDTADMVPGYIQLAKLAIPYVYGRRLYLVISLAVYHNSTTVLEFEQHVAVLLWNNLGYVPELACELVGGGFVFPDTAELPVEIEPRVRFFLLLGNHLFVSRRSFAWR